ncbi:MAG: tetratricopeptide repeat protein [Phaeodactylibacter sp.]|nr:tetratricopeptide repeat protein [Phaeodactylibacter sp.]MCB9302633.1 tetratricopeptide repeat protein [Lewinellaceae bacterium]
MVIIIPKDELLHILFPGLQPDAAEADILRAFRKQYTIGNYTPDIKIDGAQVAIHFDEHLAQAARETQQRIIALSEKGQYAQAKALLEPIIQAGASNSELYRIYGQILYQEGDTDAAMNHLIDALRWNPENTAALIMLGNLYAQVQDDLPTALQFFQKAVSLQPGDYTALNNLAGILAKTNRMEEALERFHRVLELKPDYPQASYGIALIFEQQGNLLEAFNWAIRALQAASGEYQSMEPTCRKFAYHVAKSYMEATDPEELYGPYLQKLQARSSRPIRLEEATDIPVPAKLLVAEYRHIDTHTVQFKPGQPYATHLIMHELGHLDLILEARQARENQLFVSNDLNYQQFLSRTSKDRQKMLKSGLLSNQADGFLKFLFQGINSQLYNAPLDLFIEERLFHSYPELRPVQFLSLRALYQDAIDGANNKQVGGLAPAFVRNANITLSYVLLLQYRALFGLDLTAEIREPALLRKAEGFYQDYLDMKDDKGPGEEYDLIEWWGEDLKLKGLYRLEGERG